MDFIEGKQVRKNKFNRTDKINKMRYCILQMILHNLIKVC